MSKVLGSQRGRNTLHPLSFKPVGHLRPIRGTLGARQLLTPRQAMSSGMVQRSECISWGPAAMLHSPSSCRGREYPTFIKGVIQWKKRRDKGLALLWGKGTPSKTPGGAGSGL